MADKRFDFQFVHPPYAYEWSKDFDAVIHLPRPPRSTATAVLAAALAELT